MIRGSAEAVELQARRTCPGRSWVSSHRVPIGFPSGASGASGARNDARSNWTNLPGPRAANGHGHSQKFMKFTRQQGKLLCTQACDTQRENYVTTLKPPWRSEIYRDRDGDRDRDR